MKFFRDLLYSRIFSKKKFCTGSAKNNFELTSYGGK